jgi:hypothetical protein
VACPFGPGCDIGAVERAVPSATTGAASGIGPTVATLNGTVDNPGPVASARLEYGTTTAYGSQTPAQAIPAGASDAAVSAFTGTLVPSTTYH